ncbi:MAG: serine hydrolase [bacterium]|nr:serine hydrolase [bacterium]MCY3890475.1 serine hydrolase [bacterium]MCY3961723.1 serine hydrolase [bacterium]MCY4134878.1 serine hydrolase [bacterium]
MRLTSPGGFARLSTALVALGLLCGTAACAEESEVVLEVTSIGGEATPTVVPTPVPAAVPTPTSPAPAPTPSPTIEATVPANPEPTVEPTPTPDRSAQEFLDSLAEEFHFVLAEVFEYLAEVSEEWNPDGQISIAVVLPDETLHGYEATESRISASAVKPMWAAAALDSAGVEAASSSAYSALILSDNLAGGRLIDLAGGVDAVNAWTRNVAQLSDTRLEAWRFQDPNRVASSFNPENPLGNRTTMADLALFFARLYKGELLDPDENAALQQWLLDTSHSLHSSRDLDGVLLDRLPTQVAESSLHKAGWLRPNCCPAEYRQMIDAGIIVLPDDSWYALAILSSRGEFYDLTNQWVALAACRIYAFVAEDRELVCEREGDGVHDPEIWPEAGTGG